MQRADSGIWLYPTGWADVGYSPAEVAVKEVAEETGIECEPLRLLAVIDGQRMGFTRFGMYMLLFHCLATGGELRPHPLETADVGWFADDALPEPTAGAQWWGPMAFAAIRGEECAGHVRPGPLAGLARRLTRAVGRREPRRRSVVGAVAQEPLDLFDQLVGIERLGEVVVAVVIVVVGRVELGARRRPAARGGARTRRGRRRRRSATATRASYSAAAAASRLSGAGVPIIEQARSTSAIAAFGDGICDA